MDQCSITYYIIGVKKKKNGNKENYQIILCKLRVGAENLLVGVRNEKWRNHWSWTNEESMNGYIYEKLSGESESNLLGGKDTGPWLLEITVSDS